MPTCARIAVAERRMSSSAVRGLHTEIRIAGSPRPIPCRSSSMPPRVDRIDDLIGDVRAIAREADQHLVEDYMVEDRGPGIARQLLGHEPRAATAALDRRGNPGASQLAGRGQGPQVGVPSGGAVVQQPLATFPMAAP